MNRGTDRLHGIDPISLFSSYMQITGVPSLADEADGDPQLLGKSLGIINGSAWIHLWSTYFGRLFLPGVKLVAVGNEAVQLNFMRAHENGEEVPPALNRELFCSYARHLVDLVKVDAILLTCSTMNRAYREVAATVSGRGVPVVQIDEPMMDDAVAIGGTTLVIATHGPTVENTRMLLSETAQKQGTSITIEGVTREECFQALGAGDIQKHNELIAETIREAKARPIDAVVLAQLSMAVFLFSFPEPEAEFGVPVLTSAQSGFRRIRAILTGSRQQPPQRP